MKNHITISLLFLCIFVQGLKANIIDSLEMNLRDHAQIQEKIYLHTDNNCYFVGDTIWYKAYLLRADSHQPSPLSRVMYVELISPDGYVIERQRLIVSHDSQSASQFYLPDTIYSGFYELRAYTRWQLNFNVEQKEHNRFDDEWFYNKELADDYFRHFEGLYSRVIPIYEKPQEAGEYADKRIAERPKRRLAKEKTDIQVKFYPEGGNLVVGLPCQVAFEVLDPYGKPLDIEGNLSNGTLLKTIADGRGVFSYQPTSQHSIKATFAYQDKNFTFELPKALPTGISIFHDAEKMATEIKNNGLEIGAVAVTCRGRLVSFQRDASTPIFDQDLPTGVNEIMVYSPTGQPIASRQIFVNHHDSGEELLIQLTMSENGSIVETVSAPAYKQLNLDVTGGSQNLRTVSVAVRDERTNDRSYDDGNILTDLLLAGDLRGFVAHPAYYFEKEDLEHRQRLDLLMMIQGWHKYAQIPTYRYMPERGFVLSGQIHKLLTNESNEFDMLDYTHQSSNDGNPSFTIKSGKQIKMLNDNTVIESAQGLTGNDEDNSGENTSEKSSSDDSQTTSEPIQNEVIKHKRNLLKKPAMVEAELLKDKDIAGAITMADSVGNFSINLPPFYDQGIMIMTAYAQEDSTKMCLASRSDKEKINPLACPEYYVHREMFYPVFTNPYSWFQTHLPEEPDDLDMEGVTAQDSLLSDHILSNVTIKTRRVRKLRRFDKSKPAMVMDFNLLLNNATDYGLHFGGYNGIIFWDEAAHYLFGNMGNSNKGIGIQAEVDEHIFLKTYKAPENEGFGKPMSPSVLKQKTDPRYIWKVRIFTDYDMRNNVGREENRSAPDVKFTLVSVPNDGSRPMRRDRRFVFDGFSYQDEFYNPDYSNAIPDVPSDYRRTLYWNGNAHFNEEGKLHIQFFNGSRPTRMTISVCGVGYDGKIYYNK